ncbi:hypothetical protein H8356DRAFT_1379452 [Neocallimastix lanati (nom. inval.)]|uniref:Uncharacterized protein n=2 Tax=Neocallimastix californiae TaxID=1754190 RepID=A0A1Y2AX03_9FUNG|nr:hypothetical protein H8356DRAFT_1379452 [Neocallimastix sp. JGI-2020a]ORY26830.1 hypothetical protein LY90DRAFT_513642 [Neocallimastix californiae]|eukprot:ORY26830.1 hypothetical protein LY90DRAFT_513642 [Neocallimastix californiae]
MEENLIIDIIPKFMYRNKCKSFIILNDKKEILKYDSSHNHPKKEYDVSLSIMKHKIKNGIEKSSIPFGIKIKPLYNKISKEMRFICPEYNSIKSQISRNLNKKLPSNLTTFTEIPNKSKYYKPKRESLNSYLINLFPTKPSYYELIDKLNELEHLPYYDYQRKIRGIWKIKKRAINKTNEISVLIEPYKNIEAKLINAKWDRNNTINLWFDCLTDLNNIL